MLSSRLKQSGVFAVLAAFLDRQGYSGCAVSDLHNSIWQKASALAFYEWDGTLGPPPVVSARFLIW